MNTDLFTSLRKYHPREGHDPLENFITEAFAWLLRSHIEFSKTFLSNIFQKLEQNVEKNLLTSDYEHGNWKTQVYWNGVYPDMIYESGENVLIFEHKAWSKLHDKQLENYRNQAKNKYNNHFVVLITASRNQHEQFPDIALCWSDIYLLIRSWLDNNKHSIENNFVFESFLNLIKQEGMGIKAPIAEESIRSYHASRYFKENTSHLIKSISGHNWSNVTGMKDHEFRVAKNNQLYGEANGRIGFNLFSKWRPSIFVGFLIDPKDHKVISILNEVSPDYCIILSFTEKLHKHYPVNDMYKTFSEKLKGKIEKLNIDVEFYNHLDDPRVEKPNLWHPIHLRKPMIELFKSTESHEEQKEIFIKTTEKLLTEIISCDEFYHLRELYKDDKYNYCSDSQYGCT